MVITPLERIIRDHSEEPVAEELNQVSQSARELMDTIDQLLDFKQLSGSAAKFQPSYGDIAAFTADVCRSYASVMGKGGDGITVDTGKEPIMTGFDRDHIRRILHILIGNAYKYRCPDEALRVHVTVREEGGNAVIRVADNGRGISDKAKHHVFELLEDEADKEDHSHTPILSIVREYVRQHGGSITVTDNQPSGCVFIVSIPVNSNLKPMAPAEREAKRTGRPYILNVGNNPAFRFFVSEHLSLNYDIVDASNGKQALELIADNDFDLIISDQDMPEMDGRELCRALRADIRYANTPIILLTTVHGEAADLENLKAGADDTLEMPFNIESLIIRIERLLKRKTPLAGYTDASGHRISRADRELLDRITAEIEENLQESEYTIESLCTALGISRSGLYKKMMALTGKSPLEYIRLLRLEKGRDMLENGETSVSQIAWSVGFSPKQFSKHFKDEYGCLPSEYIHSLSN